jgi:UDP-N-acetylmuramyl pentapeptide phosphotransferase/UDP-N-acetylglucosamine-1-phosphate transferase
MLMPILTIILCATLSWFICGKVRGHLLAASILDNPNERSMHTAPVPRGGGIAIWLTVFPVWILYDLFNGQFFEHFFIMLGAGALIIVSWLDDKKSLPARERFMVHILAVALGLISLPITHYVFQGILPLWLDRVVAGFAWLWFINLTNFMDGIDGLSGAQTAHTGIGFIIIAALSAAIPETSLIIAACITGAALGFLVWNWHPAKLFLGDVGSIPLGYLLGYLLMILAVNGYLGIALALPLYYVADASITLIRRMVEKKKFWQAHREHFYQKATLGTGSPVQVVIPIIITNIGLLLISVVALTVNVWLLLLAPLLVAGLLWYLNCMKNTTKAEA